MTSQKAVVHLNFFKHRKQAIYSLIPMQRILKLFMSYFTVLYIAEEIEQLVADNCSIRVP